MHWLSQDSYYLLHKKYGNNLVMNIVNSFNKISFSELQEIKNIHNIYLIAQLYAKFL